MARAVSGTGSHRAASPTPVDAESRRLAECSAQGVPWRKWGPYLSERQWGTVREDYSEHGNAWSYFTHDQARSRAYGWGEDGLAGFSAVAAGSHFRYAPGADGAAPSMKTARSRMTVPRSAV